MKVAFIVGGFPALSETFILNQITGLLDLGFDVSIFANYNPEEPKTHPDVDKYSLMERVHYINEIPKNKINRLLRSLSLTIPNFHRNPGSILKSLNVFRYGRKALSLTLLYPIIPFLEMDIIHCHFGYNAIFGSFLKKFGVKAPLITTFHGYDLSAFILDKGENVYDDVFFFGDLFLPISEYWRRKLVRMKVDEQKILVHRMGIELEKFQYQERRLHPGETLKILTVGRMFEKKGHEYAIKGVAQLIKKQRDVMYTIAGDGPLRDTLKNLVSDLNIEEKVKFVGFVQQDEVVDLFKDAHIFLLPSVTAMAGDQEGIPVVLMEAQAVGLPIVSTYHSGIPELVEDGGSGFLVPEKDVVQLAEKLFYLTEHPQLLSKMGTRGRRIVEEKFNIKKLNRQLADIFYSFN